MDNNSQNFNLPEELLALPTVKEKFIVDFANTIDVSNDLIQISENRNKFYQIILDWVSGNSKRRNDEINKNINNGLNSALTYLTEFSKSLSICDAAIIEVEKKVKEIEENISVLADFSDDNRKQINELTMFVNERLTNHETEIRRIDFEQKASRSLEQSFNKWKAGDYNKLSVAARFFAVLDDLWWGDFGEYCRNSCNDKVKESFIEDLVNRSSIQLNNDVQIKAKQRLPIEKWLQFPEKNEMLINCISYIGDKFSVEKQPLCFTVSQFSSLNSLPIQVPRICHSKRIATAMINDYFGGYCYAR